MNEEIDKILNSTNKRQYLIDVLDKILKESNFYSQIIEKAESIADRNTKDYKELCNQLSEYVFENMPEKAKEEFEKEIMDFINKDIKSKINFC